MMTMKQLVACLAVAGALVAGHAPAHSEDLTPLEQVRRSVVSVMPQWQGQPPNKERPEGSGVVVGDGKIVVTAAHVIGSGQQVAGDILVRDYDGNLQRVQVLAHDPVTDLAVLSLATPLVPARWSANAPRAGEAACAIGNAFGLGLSVTCGHVSAVNRAGVGFNAIEDFIQTDAAVNPGMSGGALVDMEGEVTGILSAIFTKQADANIGVNFAVDARLVQVFVQAREATGKFMPFNPGAGVRSFPHTPEPGREGVEIIGVVPGFPAQLAGLKPGDIVHQVAGRRVRKAADWRSVMAVSAGAASIALAGVRGAAAMTWTLRRHSQ
jgi:S1-C subfamily serine protease